jgi:hypothetical protein
MSVKESVKNTPLSPYCWGFVSRLFKSFFECLLNGVLNSAKKNIKLAPFLTLLA